MTGIDRLNGTRTKGVGAPAGGAHARRGRPPRGAAAPRRPRSRCRSSPSPVGTERHGGHRHRRGGARRSGGCARRGRRGRHRSPARIPPHPRDPTTPTTPPVTDPVTDVVDDVVDTVPPPARSGDPGRDRPARRHDTVRSTPSSTRGADHAADPPGTATRSRRCRPTHRAARRLADPGQVLTPLSPVAEQAAPTLPVEKVVAEPRVPVAVLDQLVPPLAPKYSLPGTPTRRRSRAAPRQRAARPSAPQRDGGPAPATPARAQGARRRPSVGGASSGGAFFAGTLFAALLALMGLAGLSSRRLREAADRLRPQAYIALLERPG